MFLQGVLLHYFNINKTAVESHRILVEVYGEHALAGQPKKFEDKELKALHDEDCCQT